MGQAFQHDGEFVAADAGDGALRARHFLQPLGGSAQHAVAGGMAQRIVDVLEVVQIEEQQCQPVALPACLHDGARQAFGQQGAVRQVGQRIVVGEVTQLVLDAAPFGDVAGHQHEQLPLGGGFAQRTALHRAQEIAAVLAALPHLATPAVLGVDGTSSVLVERRFVAVAVQQAGVAAQDLCFRIPGHAAERGIDRHEAEIGVQHRHRLGHAAHHLRGDLALVLHFAQRIDVARGAGDPRDPAVGAVADGAAAYPHPLPLSVLTPHPVFRQEHWHFPPQVGPQLAQHAPAIGVVEPGVAFDAGLHGQPVVAFRGHPGDLQFAAAQVVLPEHFVGGPQRQPPLLRTFVLFALVGALFAFAAPVAGQRQPRQQQDQQRQQQGQRRPRRQTTLHREGRQGQQQRAAGKAQFCRNDAIPHRRSVGMRAWRQQAAHDC